LETAVWLNPGQVSADNPQMPRVTRRQPLPESAITGSKLCIWMRAVVLLLLGLLCSSLGARADPGAPLPLTLGAKDDSVSVWPALNLRTGLPQGISLEEGTGGRAPWTAAPQPQGNLGPQRQPVVLAFDIVVAPGGSGDWVLEIDYPSLDHVEIEVRDDNGFRQIWVMGDHHPYRQRALASRSLAVPLNLQPGQYYQVTGLVQTTGSMLLPMRMVRAEVFRHSEAREGLLQGLLTGAMLCLLIHALAQGRAMREPAFFWYATNVLGTTLFFFSYSGLGVQHLWGNHAWASEKATMLTGLLGLGSAFCYMDAMLDLTRRSPRTGHAMRSLSAVVFITLGLFATGLISYPAAHLVNVALSPAPLLLALPITWKLARGGDRIARLLMVSWIFYGICAVTFTLLQRGLVPADFWTMHAFQFGTVAELILWMAMLGLRTRATQEAGERARNERDILDKLAHSDALTGLLNRRGLQQLAEPRLDACRPDEVHAIYLIDLDRFKPINDQYGHDAGDMVLRELARRLQSAVRQNDLVARLGGDEFVVMAGPLRKEGDAQALAHKLLQTVATPIDVEGRALTLGMTMGYAMCPSDSRSLPELLRRADAAMYAGKAAGRGSVWRSLPASASDGSGPAESLVRCP
jgi:diguanylate cyclase